MVKLISATPEELKGCVGFGFKTKQNTQQDLDTVH